MRFLMLIRQTFIAAFLLFPITVNGENWPQWRGPRGNGVTTNKGLPAKWSENRNVLWRVKVPGFGASSPIVWGDRIVVTSALEGGTKRVTACYDRRSGKRLWLREVLDKDPDATSPLTGHAAPTPATNGKRIVAYFGNAGVVCYDLQGRPLWRRRFGEFDTELGIASSPIIDGQRVFLVCDHDGDRFSSFDSFVISLSLGTGQVVWKKPRSKMGRSWSTPVISQSGKQPAELVVAGDGGLKAYDCNKGRENWHFSGLKIWVAPTPVLAKGILFVTSGRNGPILAIERRATTKLIWNKPTGGSYVCSPLVHGSLLYVHTGEGILSCYEIRSGKQVYRKRLPGKFTASAIADSQHLYLTNENATTYVLALGSAGRIVATNQLSGQCLSSPAVAGDAILIRTRQWLYCLATK